MTQIPFLVALQELTLTNAVFAPKL